MCDRRRQPLTLRVRHDTEWYRVAFSGEAASHLTLQVLVAAIRAKIATAPPEGWDRDDIIDAKLVGLRTLPDLVRLQDDEDVRAIGAGAQLELVLKK